LIGKPQFIIRVIIHSKNTQILKHNTIYQKTYKQEIINLTKIIKKAIIKSGV
jgi:hypothetical protein